MLIVDVGARRWLPAVNGDVFQQAWIEAAVAIVQRRQGLPIRFGRIEKAVQVRVLAVKKFKVEAVNESQFVHRLEWRVLAQVRWLEPQVGF